MAPATRATLAAGLAIVLLATAAGAQDRPAGAFKVSWEPRGAGGVPMIDGLVHNDLPYRVTDVRLQIEGLDAGDRPVGLTLAWALGDIAPGGESTFIAESIPGAVTYRITVDSFDVVSGSATR